MSRGGRRATECLIAGGHSRIAHGIGWHGSSNGRDRAEGFLRAMAAAWLEPVAMVDGIHARDTADAIVRTLREGPDRPGAIFVGNDHMT